MTRSGIIAGFGAVLASLLLLGCSSGVEMSDIEARMEEIRTTPSGRVEPPPKFKPYETFTYSAALMRSPFQPTVKVDLNPRSVSTSNVRPDENRPREILERFSLEQLIMVGTISRPGEPLQALVKDGNQSIHRVRPGNFMGRNHGRVLEINVNKIDLMEIVPDGQGGWVERPRTVVLKDQG